MFHENFSLFSIAPPITGLLSTTQKNKYESHSSIISLVLISAYKNTKKRLYLLAFCLLSSPILCANKINSVCVVIWSIVSLLCVDCWALLSTSYIAFYINKQNIFIESIRNSRTVHPGITFNTNVFWNYCRYITSNVCCITLDYLLVIGPFLLFFKFSRPYCLCTIVLEALLFLEFVH